MMKKRQRLKLLSIAQKRGIESLKAKHQRALVNYYLVGLPKICIGLIHLINKRFDGFARTVAKFKPGKEIAFRAKPANLDARVIYSKGVIA